MADLWVANASPIIVLAKSGHLNLLPQSAAEILVPEAVATEILAAASDDPARLAIEQGFGTRMASVLVPQVIQEWSLGAGETAVLALAFERRGATAVLDDAQARRCARTLSIPVIGTLGLVLRARKKDLIPSAVTVLRDIKAAGLFLDEELIRAALQLVGESWP